MKKKTIRKSALKPVNRKKETASRQHLRLIPWAMAALTVFYLISLLAIIRVYPDLFSVPSSYAENLTRASLSPSVINTDAGVSSVGVSKETLSPPAAEETILKKESAPAAETTETKVDAASINSSSVKSPAESPVPDEAVRTNEDTGTGSSSAASATVTASESKVTNISPNLKFSIPSKGVSLKGKQTFAASVENALGVEFYLVKSGSLTSQFLCKAKNSSGDSWKCEIQTSDIPNGEYELTAKISNNYGSYESSGVSVKISNEAAKITSSSDSSKESAPASASKDNAAAPNSADKKQSAKVASQEAEKVKETIETRSREQESRKNITGGVSENATVAGALPQSLDNDQDGVSNDEEERISTNPNSADTDKDGYLDGDEIKKGFNPAKASEDDEDKIVFESPKEKGEVKKDLVKIESVGMISKSSDNADEASGGAGKAIRLKGKGLPNSFVTIYIYSETPTIVTVMTDKNGNWTYSMDKDFENGTHEAYVAITDNEGHITAKSEPFIFVKTAQAATKAAEQDLAAQNTLATQSPMAASKTRRTAAIGILIIISLFTAVASIGLYLIYHHHQTKAEPVTKKDYLIDK
ncbi:MAG: Ig-like domain-containing protein [Parcubacteria group bacterium]